MLFAVVRHPCAPSPAPRFCESASTRANNPPHPNLPLPLPLLRNLTGRLHPHRPFHFHPECLLYAQRHATRQTSVAIQQAHRRPLQTSGTALLLSCRHIAGIQFARVSLNAREPDDRSRCEFPVWVIPYADFF